MPEHNTLTGSSLHEPKGVAAATADQVYVSDGAGSGTWTDTSSLVSGSDGFGYVCTETYAVRTQGTSTFYIPIPTGGTITSVEFLNIASATDNPEVQIKTAAGLSMYSGTVTLTNGALDQVTYTPNQNNTVTAGTYIQVVFGNLGLSPDNDVVVAIKVS